MVNLRKKCKKNLLRRNHKGDEADIFIHAYGIILYINCVFFLFCSGNNWLLWHFVFHFCVYTWPIFM